MYHSDDEIRGKLAGKSKYGFTTHFHKNIFYWICIKIFKKKLLSLKACVKAGSLEVSKSKKEATIRTLSLISRTTRAPMPKFWMSTLPTFDKGH